MISIEHRLLYNLDFTVSPADKPVPLTSYVAREGRDVGAARDVANAVIAAEFCREPAQALFPAAGHHDPGTFAREAAGDDLSHVAFAGGTQNHCDFAVDASHDEYPGY